MPRQIACWVLLLACSDDSGAGGTAEQKARGCKVDADCGENSVCAVGGVCAKRENLDPNDPADIFLATDTLDFGAPLLFSAVTKTVEFANLGAQPLVVSRIEIVENDDRAEFTAETSGGRELVLQSRETASVNVTLIGSDDQEDIGELCIHSSDPDESPACINLVSQIKGDAALCACVLNEDGGDPLEACDPADELIALDGVDGASAIISIHNCGSDNRPLTIEEGGIFTSDTAVDGDVPFRVESFRDVDFLEPATFPLLLNPGAEGVFVRLTVEGMPGSAAPPPEEQLVIHSLDRDQVLSSAIDIELALVGCPVGSVDLNHLSADGCECQIASEICNGIDDDCDGVVDQGAPTGDLCDGSDGDLCLEGTTSCSGGVLVCSDTTGATIEACNNTDDDCDGSVDEDVLGASCDGSDADFCSEGTMTCLAGEFVCGDVTGSNPELCNGADDDCDGLRDEGVGECASGSGATSAAGCGPCQTRPCNSSCEFGDCTACTCDMLSICGVVCPAGYHSTSARCDFSCGACFSSPNAVVCQPNCGSSFGQCGLICPSGYAATSYSCDFSCSIGGCFSSNAATCTQI